MNQDESGFYAAITALIGTLLDSGRVIPDQVAGGQGTQRALEVLRDFVFNKDLLRPDVPNANLNYQDSLAD